MFLFKFNLLFFSGFRISRILDFGLSIFYSQNLFKMIQ